MNNIDLNFVIEKFKSNYTEEAYPLMTAEQLDNCKKIIKERTQCELPEEYEQFITQINGYCFQGCSCILGINIENDETKTYIDFGQENYDFKEFIIDDIDEPMIVVATGNCKKFIYIPKFKKYYEIYDDQLYEIKELIELGGTMEYKKEFNSFLEVVLFLEYTDGTLKIFEQEAKQLLSKYID